MSCTALVPLQFKRRFRFSLMNNGSWVVFDTARCCFIFPEWMWIQPTYGLMTKNEVQERDKRDFEEVQRIIKGFDSFCEAYLRAFAADRRIPYDLMVRPIPKVRHE
jgi:hypothetical protein